MKYFTMEELDDITKELIDNPSRETLKKLNNKYNGEEINTKWIETQDDKSLFETLQGQNSKINAPKDKVETLEASQENVVSLPNNDISTPNIPIWNSVNNNDSLSLNNPENNNNQTIEDKKDDVSIPILDESSLSSLQIQGEPVIDNNSLNEAPINFSNVNTIPSLEIPKNEPFVPNNNAVPFNGNLWESQNNMVNSMMQTTDNFNKPIEQMSNNQTVLNQNQFYNMNTSPANNPIPVTGPSVPEGPTMFGQFEQNFNNNAA